MIKVYCDQCGKEVDLAGYSNNKLGRMSASVGHLDVEVIVSQNGVSNRGDYCKYCILDALYTQDDRPKGEYPGQ